MTRMITNEEKIFYKDLSYKIIFKLKTIERIADAHRAQTLNYLKATGLRLAILLNFGKEKLKYERFVR
jgi:GxxExxY protein